MPSVWKRIFRASEFLLPLRYGILRPMSTHTKKLMRSRTERKIAGVCGGFAEYFELDVTLVRILWLMMAFIGGWGILGYFIAWIAMPKEPLAVAVPVTSGSAIPQPAGNQ